jgi:molecular chaperone GrpE
MLQRLLPFYDVLLTAHKQVQQHAPAGAERLVEGVEMLFKELNKVFSAEGVQAIESLGKPYDHAMHEVLGTVDRDDVEDETVVDELQRGFTFGGRVLRPARVRISKKPAQAPATPGETPA